MFKTIVVGTDGSDTADIAVERAADLAKLTGGRLLMVSAYDPAAARVGGLAGSEAAAFLPAPDYKVTGVLDRTAGRLRASGIEVEPHPAKGDPADALVEVATREHADLIVLGSRGMTGARRVLGSVPNKVSHHAPCDVLIVHTA